MREDELHKQVACYLRYYEKTHKNLKFWTYEPFGEKRPPITASLLKAKGTKRGVPDFQLIFENKVNKTKSIIIWLECKIGKNKQSPEQKDFERIIGQFEDQYYYLVYDLNDLEKVLNFTEF